MQTNPQSSTALRRPQRPPSLVTIHNERKEPIRVVDAIAGELHVQVHLGGAGGDNLAKIPSIVVPVQAGAGEEVAKVGSGLIPQPHLARGEPVMAGSAVSRARLFRRRHSAQP